jgi:nucleoside-diphosphate-sugar epimerase
MTHPTPQEMHTKTVVLSGSGGFVGSHVKKAFIARGYAVIDVPRLLLLQPDLLHDFFVETKPHIILNLAACGNHAYQQDELEMVRANYLGMVNLLLASKDIPYEAFCQVGSSAEYGSKLTPMREDDLPETKTFYGATKVGATYFAQAFAEQYKKPVVIARLFSVYGPAEADFRFIPTVIQHLLTNRTFSLEPEATHDWIYIQDVLTAFSLIIENAAAVTGTIVNIGTGKNFTNQEVVRVLEKISGTSGTYTCVSGLRPYHSYTWVANNERLKALGWKQQYSIDKGLEETFDFYKCLV